MVRFVRSICFPPEFSKLTLATTKTVAVQATNKDLNTGVKVTQTITHTTTKRTTLSNSINDGDFESEPIPCAQQPKILLCESTVGQDDDDDDNGGMLTDDDTDTMGSISIDSQEIEDGLKELSQPTQDNGNNPIENIGNTDQVDTIDAIGDSESFGSMEPIQDTEPNKVVKPTESMESEKSIEQIESIVVAQPAEYLYPVNELYDIETQMQSLSFISPFIANSVRPKNDENMQNLSHQLKRMDIAVEKGEEQKPLTAETIESANVSEKKAVLECSIQTLSSTEPEEHKPSVEKDCNESSDVIVLSDSECGDEPAMLNAKSSAIPPISEPSENDGAVYNTSSLMPKSMVELDSEVEKKLNRFFDNIPFVEPAENSFNTTQLSATVDDPLFVAETSDEGSVVDKTASEVSASQHSEPVAPIVTAPKPAISVKLTKSNESEHNERPKASKEVTRPTTPAEISSNSIVVDIPVIKSSSDQPSSVIRSHSGVRLKTSNSSPIIKLNSIDGQVNISAKININIQIAPMTDSSSDASSDRGSKSSKSEPVTSSDDQNANDPVTSKEKVVTVNIEEVVMSDENRAPSKGAQLKKPSVVNSPRTPTVERKKTIQGDTIKTPSTASKLKQFTFQAPRSMTKTKPNDTPKSKKPTKDANDTSTGDDDGNQSKFKVDDNIPISAEHQMLLYKVYGDDWKTPEVVRSYSAVKNRDIQRTAGESTPTINRNRYSKGFHMCKLDFVVFVQMGE